VHMQFTSKGTVDGGFIETGRLRMVLRKAMKERSTELAAAEAKSATIQQQISAIEQQCKLVETNVLRSDAKKKKVQSAEAELQSTLDALLAEVWRQGRTVSSLHS
jgi:septal ring factor EnvC (AmiA/AmiB activator)